MNNEQNNNPTPRPTTQVSSCGECNQGPCTCLKNTDSSNHSQAVSFDETPSNENDKREDRKQQGEKKPPKIRWI